MMSHVTVREYARLTTAPVPTPNLDLAQISQTAFVWLCNLAGRFRRSGAQLLQLENRLEVRLDNFVGVLQSPCGQVIEILPKHVDCKSDDPHDEYRTARRMLCKLIAGALDLPAREAPEAALELYEAPLTEWVAREFLLAVERLAKRGVRSEYLEFEERQHYLRGQLNVARQLRLPMHQLHMFEIRHSVFDPNRAENRVIRTCLDIVLRGTKSAGNWRLARELTDTLRDIPLCRDNVRDLMAWRDDRLMTHYNPVKPWCELILRQHLPLAGLGEWRGISFLFPMERLFERFVFRAISARLLPGARLLKHSRAHSLCTHRNEPMFQLQPDLLLKHEGKQWVMDTKWKRLDTRDPKGKYGLSQADFYQLFAYGHYYQEGTGDMLLIYPSWRGFRAPLEPFHFRGQFSVWAIPFDLEKEVLYCPDS